MWRGVLSVGLLGLIAAGCNQMTMNLSEGRDSGFPKIGWSPVAHERNLAAKILTLDGQEVGSKTLAYVNPGEHTVAWECFTVPRQNNQPLNSGKLSLNVRDDTMYYIRPSRRTRTESGVRQEALQLVTTMTRGPDGKLLAKIEPVYYDVPYSNTYTTGCGVEVIACKGYLYGAYGGSKFSCLDEPASKLKMVLLRSPDGLDWRDLQ